MSKDRISLILDRVSRGSMQPGDAQALAEEVCRLRAAIRDVALANVEMKGTVR
jgi:hypothetical protein